MINLIDLRKIVDQDLKVLRFDAESIIIPILKKIPVPETKVNSNTFIERAVNVDISEAPFGLSRVSYLPDSLKHLATAGRFNNDNEPMFYGAFSDLKDSQLTRYFLACEIKQNLFKVSDCDFKYTVSKWRTIGSFPAVIFVFDAKYCTGNDLMTDAFHAFQSNSDYINLSADEKEVLKLITIELAKPSPVNGYTISNVIFDFYKGQKYGAIIYPGVQSRYRGNNIAIIPELVDKYLEFYMGAEFELIKKGDSIVVENLYGLSLNSDKLEHFKFDPSEFGESESFPK